MEHHPFLRTENKGAGKYRAQTRTRPRQIKCFQEKTATGLEQPRTRGSTLHTITQLTPIPTIQILWPTSTSQLISFFWLPTTLININIHKTTSLHLKRILNLQGEQTSRPQLSYSANGLGYSPQVFLPSQKVWMAQHPPIVERSAHGGLLHRPCWRIRRWACQDCGKLTIL